MLISSQLELHMLNELVTCHHEITLWARTLHQCLFTEQSVVYRIYNQEYSCGMRHHSECMTQEVPIKIFVKDMAEDFFLPLVSGYFCLFLY